MKTKESIFSIPRSILQENLVAHGCSKFSATQVYDWLYRKFNTDVTEWSNVSKAAKAYLQEEFSFFLPEIVTSQESQDGTKKFLLKLQDGETIESVIIPGLDRLTICVSSQVGCAVKCTFCHTGTQGFTRNLSTGEIVGQLYLLQRLLKESGPETRLISNVVFMGQGEPLHNFENVKHAIEIMLDNQGFFIGQRKITVSTSGMVPQLERINELPPVNLAISLHASNNQVREQLMPLNKKYPLETLFAAIKKFPLKAHRWITYEYLLIDELNNSKQDIEQLCRLLDKNSSKMNLIPFNEYPGAVYKRPSDKNIHWFAQQMTDNGIPCTIRHSKGDDILAACGQLKSQTKDQGS